MSGPKGGACLLLRSLDLGGAERQAVLLARGLATRGIPTSVLLFYPGGDLEGGLDGSDVEVVHLAKRHRWDLAGFGYRLVRALRARRPLVVYGFLPTSNLLLAVTRPFHRLPVAFGLRGSSRAAAPRHLARVERRVEPIASRLAETVITNSVAGRDDALSRGFAASKLKVVPNGVDGQRFSFDRQARTARRRALAADGPLVGIVGRLDPIKDHETFLGAFHLVLETHPTARALIVGADPGGRAAALAAAAATAGITDHVTLTGATDDLAGVYSACDAIVLSSRSEGVPNVLLEALSCGTPCAATAVGDVRAILDDDRLVAPVADATRLAAAIEAALRLPADDTARAERRADLLARYGAERMVTETIAALGLDRCAG